MSYKCDRECFNRNNDGYCKDEWCKNPAMFQPYGGAYRYAEYAEETLPKSYKDHFNISYLELAKRDNDESQSHLCNSLNAMHGLFMHLGSTNDGAYIPVKASTLYTAGLYFERAQNLITYLQSELNKNMEEK